LLLLLLLHAGTSDVNAAVGAHLKNTMLRPLLKLRLAMAINTASFNTAAEPLSRTSCEAHRAAGSRHAITVFQVIW
jgi:hypothetical protein